MKLLRFEDFTTRMADKLRLRGPKGHYAKDEGIKTVSRVERLADSGP